MSGRLAVSADCGWDQAAHEGDHHAVAGGQSLYFLAPVVILMPALAAWAVIPFGPGIVLADINAGLLFVMAITSVGVYGVIIAGWASNSKYAFLGCARRRRWSATKSAWALCW